VGYWNSVVRSHERMSTDFPNGEKGLRAVRFLRSFFEQMGCEQLHPNHPLHNRLSIGFDPNYLWLVQYARKLLTARSISGFERVAKRLIDREYVAAHNEIEVALKLHLEGLDVYFSCADSRHTSDMILRLGGDTVRIEVSSLNPPEEENRVQQLISQSWVLTMKGVVSGGFIGRISSFKKLNYVIDRMREAADIVTRTRQMKKLSFKGVATIFLAPRDKVHQIPEDCRGIYYFTSPYHRSIEERIEKKIKEKSEQTFGNNRPGLLFLYTRIIDRQAISQLFEPTLDDVTVILSSYPKLLGLVLTVPHLGIEVGSAVKSEALQRKHKGNKVFLESEAGMYEYESSVIWKNLHADRSFPKEILRAMENYPSNLSKLTPLS